MTRVIRAAGPMPVFDGAAEVVELLRELYRRPRISELPRREWGNRDRRLRRGLPMLCLVRPAGLEVLRALGGYLGRTGQGRIPHVMFTFSALGERHAPTGDVDELEVVRSILFDLARGLGGGLNASTGRIRFRRFGLASWLLQQDVRDGDLEPDRVLLQRLRERSLAQRRLAGIGDEVQTELRNNLPVPWWVRPLLPLLRWLPPLWFGWKASGRLPLFGGAYRWFLRQPYLAPRDPGTFVGFAERLTLGIRDEEDANQILKLLVNAFLEDLRRAYRRPPWRPRGARRTTYVVALLDGIRRDNHGYRVLKLVNDVRNETGAFDPLLLISGSEKLPPEALDPDSGAAQHHIWAARRARRGYQAWCNALATASRRRAPTAWYLPIRIPAAHSPPDANGITDPGDQVDSRYVVESQKLAATAPFTIDRAPAWARRTVLYPFIFVLLLAVAGGGYQELKWRADKEASWQRAHCGQSSSTPGAALLESVSQLSKECIGISDGWYRGFSKDPKFNTVLERIHQQNGDVANKHTANPDRPYVTLVYFSGLGTASESEGLVAQREALAGVAARQRQELPRKEGVLMRVLVANGGAQMAHGQVVARILARMAAEDSSIVGVLGLGQSRQPTIDTIKELTRAGLPMIAAALTADTVAEVSPMYFQVSPQNRREAAVAARYAENVLAKDWHDRRVRIVQSNDKTDTYSRTLAEDAVDSFKERGFTFESTIYYDPNPSPSLEDRIDTDPSKPADAGRDVCDSPLVFYAGRTQEFESFLGSIHDCLNKPVILAGDDVSRYVADRDKRTQFSSVAFDYLSLAVGRRQPCDGSAGSDLYYTLRELFPEDCAGGPVDPSLDGHAALAYDATLVMVKAVQALHDSEVPITAGAVWHSISGTYGNRALNGETGRINFDPTLNDKSKGQVPVDKAVVILRVSGDGDRAPVPQAYCGQQDVAPSKDWCP